MAPQIPPAPTLPFRISRISQKVERYFLYDANTITWLRREHHILGVLVGTLAQIPQQNVFLGIPLELQPEEARLLVEKRLAYVVDDQEWHSKSYSSMTIEEKEKYRQGLRQEGEKLARADVQASQKRSELALQRRQQQRQSKPEIVDPSHTSTAAEEDDLAEEDSLFAAPSPKPPSLSFSSRSSKALTPYIIIPATSQNLLPTPPVFPLQGLPLPTVNPSSYTLFKHLHNEGYFISPGLRFGCQFLVYPGDPLRFHSHFLAVSADWDEEIDLLDLVGGGRLGTGVKKGWMLGGPEGKKTEQEDEGSAHDPKSAVAGAELKVRTFCVEWGGM